VRAHWSGEQIVAQIFVFEQLIKHVFSTNPVGIVEPSISVGFAGAVETAGSAGLCRPAGRIIPHPAAGSDPIPIGSEPAWPSDYSARAIPVDGRFRPFPASLTIDSE